MLYYILMYMLAFVITYIGVKAPKEIYWLQGPEGRVERYTLISLGGTLQIVVLGYIINFISFVKNTRDFSHGMN